MARSHLNFWVHTVVGAVVGVAVLVCLKLLSPTPQPLGRLVRLFSFPVVRLFDVIVQVFWSYNPDQGMILYPLLYLTLLTYWALIGMTVAWMIYWFRRPKA